MLGSGAMSTEATTPRWERRFRAPKVTFPTWSRQAPERLVFASTESGTYQVHVWDRESGMRRRVTDDEVGVTDGTPTWDGTGVCWFRDETGDESGRWLVQAFEGGPERPFVEGVPHGWNEGLALGRSITALGISDREGFGIYVSENGEPARRIHHHVESVRVGGAESGGFDLAGLSADGSLLMLEHAEHGDMLHAAVRVVDPRTGETVGERRDEGLALRPAPWSPIPGDQRVVVIHERGDRERPAVWNLATDEWTDLDVRLPGDVDVWDWWPDGSALLLAELFEGRWRLHRFDLATGSAFRIEHPEGQISGARVRPDGSVWYRRASGAGEPKVHDQHGVEVVVPEGERAPAGEPYTSWHFTNRHDQRVHGFHVSPAGDGPFPAIMLVHGGPTWLDEDRWDPDVQALVDAGYAIGMVNYRGSIGYGAAWRDILRGDVGGPEIEDVLDGLDDLVRQGVADPARTVIAGWSWGGYITLLMIGKHPERFTAAVAGVPVGDYEASYDDSSPLLQAYDRALIGMAATEATELMRDRSPIYFVENVQTPVFILAGENDSRCPIRQVMNYVEKMKQLGKEHELYLYGTGHSSFVIEEEVRQMRLVLDFLARSAPAR